MNAIIRFLILLSLSLLCIFRLDGQSRVEKSFKMLDAIDVSLKIRSTSDILFSIAWGDGYIDTIASNQEFSRSYDSLFSGDILVLDLIGPEIRAIEISGGFAFNIRDLYSFAPFMDTLIINGGSTCYGNLASKPPSLVYLDIQTGDFYGEFNKDRLRKVIRLRVVEGNRIKLDIADFDKSINYIGITGSNEVYGTLDSFDYPSLTHFDIKGSNVITGDIGKMKNIPPIFVLRGNQTVNSYTTSDLIFTSTPELFNISSPSSSLDTEEIDQLLIDLDLAAEEWKITKTIFLNGAHSPPSDISLVARESLLAKGVNLFVN